METRQLITHRRELKKYEGSSLGKRKVVSDGNIKKQVKTNNEVTVRVNTNFIKQ